MHYLALDHYYIALVHLNPVMHTKLVYNYYGFPNYMLQSRENYKSVCFHIFYSEKCYVIEFLSSE